MKTVSLTGLKLLGLVLVYLEIYLNQVLGLFLLLSFINLWLLRLNFDGQVFVKFTYLVDGFLLLFMGNILLVGFVVVPEVCLALLFKEHLRGLEIRDVTNLKLHDKENLIMDLMTAQLQIEQLAKVTERARISADIHDHAGHDIMGAFMAFQMISDDVADELFDEALERGMSTVYWTKF